MRAGDMRRRLTRLTAPLLFACLPAPALSAEQGVVRAIDTAAAVLTIDEGRFHSSPTLRINNLGKGLNELSYARVGQPVRYTLDSAGRISELWLYPLRADERQRQGIQLGDEEQ